MAYFSAISPTSSESTEVVILEDLMDSVGVPKIITSRFSDVCEEEFIRIREDWLMQDLHEDLYEMFITDADKTLTARIGTIAKIFKVRRLMEFLLKQDARIVGPLTLPEYRWFTSCLLHDEWNNRGETNSCLLPGNISKMIHKEAMGLDGFGGFEPIYLMKAQNMPLALGYTDAIHIFQGNGWLHVVFIHLGNKFKNIDHALRWDRQNLTQGSLQLKNTMDEAMRKNGRKTDEKTTQTVRISSHLYLDQTKHTVIPPKYVEKIILFVTVWIESCGYQKVLCNNVTKRQNMCKNLEEDVLRDIMALVHKQEPGMNIRNMRIEMELMKLLGYPSYSTARIPCFMKSQYILTPRSLRFRLAEALAIQQIKYILFKCIQTIQ